MAIRDITSAEFETAVATGVSLVDFWAVWCGPCKMQGAILETKLAPAHPELNILKVDVDRNPDLAAKFGVQSIPTLLVVKNGTLVKQFVGVTSPDEILAAIARA
ncbi:MAG: thioredoxin [Kiritimatiellia bacterium]